MSFSFKILADSWKSSSSIQEGISQCSFGIVSETDISHAIAQNRTHNITIDTLCFRLCASPPFELLCEWHVVEECPRVVELRIPCSFEIPHGLHHSIDLLVAD